MGEFLQTLFVGLRLGSVYALIALGYTMVYGIIRLINFAHGDFIMVGGYTLFFTVPLMTAAGLPAWAAVVIAMAVCALVGVGVELVAYRPVRKKGTNMTALITAIAMLIDNKSVARFELRANFDMGENNTCLLYTSLENFFKRTKKIRNTYGIRNCKGNNLSLIHILVILTEMLKLLVELLSVI